MRYEMHPHRDRSKRFAICSSNNVGNQCSSDDESVNAIICMCAVVGGSQAAQFKACFASRQSTCNMVFAISALRSVVNAVPTVAESALNCLSMAGDLSQYV